MTVTKLNLGSSSAIYFVARLVPALLGFLTIPVFTRLLGVHGYGTFSLLMGAVSLFTVFSTGWLESTLIRYVGGNGSESQGYAKNYLVLLFTILVILVSIIALGAIYYSQTVNQEFQPFILPVILAFIAMALFRPLVNIYRTIELPQLYAGGMISFSTLRFILATILLLSVSPNPAMIFYAYFIVGIIVTLFPLTKMLRLAKAAQVSFDKMKQMISYGLPYLPMMVSVWVFSMYNRFALEQVMGREAVGSYSAAFNITDQSIGFLYAAIMMAVFPRLVKIYDSGDVNATKQYLQHGISLYAIVIVPAIVGYAFVGKDLLLLLASEEYSAAGMILPYLAINTGIIGINQYFSKPFELKKNTMSLMLIFVAGAGLNIILVVPLIKLYGILGAALSSTAALSFIGLLLFFYGRRMIKYELPLALVLKVIMSVLFMGLLLWLSKFIMLESAWGIVFKLAIGLLSYGIISYKFSFHRIVFKDV